MFEIELFEQSVQIKVYICSDIQSSSEIVDKFICWVFALFILLDYWALEFSIVIRLFG